MTQELGRQAGRRRKRISMTDVFLALLLTFIALIIYIPFHNTLVVSFQTIDGYTLNPGAIYPTHFTLENYIHVLSEGSIQVGYKNSIIVTVVGTMFSMTASTLYAFAISRKGMPGRKLLTVFMMVTMYFSGGNIPLFLLFRNLNMIDSLWGVILYGSVSAYNCLLIRNGFSQIPAALEEAAELDGADDVTKLVKVILPLMKPILTTFTLFAIVRLWNEWYWSMLLINDAGKMTLQVVLRSITFGNYDASVGDTNRMFATGAKMASLVLTIIPIMCVYPYLQRYFVAGITVGAVKD